MIYIYEPMLEVSYVFVVMSTKVLNSKPFTQMRIGYTEQEFCRLVALYYL